MKRVSWIAAATAAALGAVCHGALPAATADDSVSVLVRTVPLVRGSLPRTIVVYGRARPAPDARLALMAPVAARVAAVYVHTGQSVAKGAALLALVPTPTTAAAYQAAVSTERVARDALLRTRQLLVARLATETQVAAAAKTESDARATLAALRAQGAAGLTTLRAPAAAVVTTLSAIPQSIVTEGSPLVELARTRSLVLVADAMPGQALEVTAGDPVSVAPIGARGTFAARVAIRGAAADPATGLVPIDIPVPAGRMLPGEAAEATITVAVVAGFVVPHAAVLVNERGATYLVQVEAGVAKLVPVHVAVAGGDRDVVSGALDPRAPIVLAGAYQLQDGMKVRDANPAAKTGR